MTQVCAAMREGKDGESTVSSHVRRSMEVLTSSLLAFDGACGDTTSSWSLVFGGNGDDTTTHLFQPSAVATSRSHVAFDEGVLATPSSHLHIFFAEHASRHYCSHSRSMGWPSKIITSHSMSVYWLLPPPLVRTSRSMWVCQPHLPLVRIWHSMKVC